MPSSFGGQKLAQARKATARRLAEIGCTAHEIAAITGHSTLGEVERYTKAATESASHNRR